LGCATGIRGLLNSIYPRPACQPAIAERHRTANPAYGPSAEYEFLSTS
jgi:hypothetical protein